MCLFSCRSRIPQENLPRSPGDVSVICRPETINAVYRSPGFQVCCLCNHFKTCCQHGPSHRSFSPDPTVFWNGPSHPCDRFFANKLWNAGRFLLGNLKGLGEEEREALAVTGPMSAEEVCVMASFERACLAAPPIVPFGVDCS